MNGHDVATDRLALAQYRQAGCSSSEEIDSTVDRIADDMRQRAEKLTDRLPTTVRGLAQIVASIARAALTVEAISGVICERVAEELQIVRIKTVQGILSLVKGDKPHLTIAVMEHVFKLSNESEASIGRKFGEHRATVNKRVKKMQRAFGLETEQERAVAEVYSENRLAQYRQARSRIADLRG